MRVGDESAADDERPERDPESACSPVRSRPRHPARRTAHHPAIDARRCDSRDEIREMIDRLPDTGHAPARKQNWGHYTCRQGDETAAHTAPPQPQKQQRETEVKENLT